MGRPALVLTKEQEEKAIELAASGMSTEKVCEAIMVSPKFFYKHRVNTPSFMSAYAQARQEGMDALVDKLDDIHEKYDDPQVARLASDNIKWKASKIKPQVYGDRIDVNVNQTIDIKGALTEARQRTEQLSTIDVTHTALPKKPEQD